MEEKRNVKYMPVFGDDRGTYLISSKDLCMIEHLPLFADAGIDSFKIEGRMKGINYAAGVTKVYREAIDAIKKGKRSSREFPPLHSLLLRRGDFRISCHLCGWDVYFLAHQILLPYRGFVSLG